MQKKANDKHLEWVRSSYSDFLSFLLTNSGMYYR